MNYDDSVAWLYATQLHGIKLGLENIRRLANALGVALGGDQAPRFLHVAGTNGKGSVCAMLDAICRAAGHRTGLFTSPHLITFRERMRVNGEMISEDEVARELTRIKDLTAAWDHVPTFFEITTALALAHFQREGCDVVVLETGLGGRLDATNAVMPAVCVLTEIALDHQQWLGSTVAEIAAEKAGIFKDGVPVISAPQVPEVRRVLDNHGEESGALVVAYVEEPWDASIVNLIGQHQRWNAALAVHALALSGIRVEPSAVSQGLREVQWPGRFQRVNERVVIDGAHNPSAAALLTRTWGEVFGTRRATVILGVLGDKDVRGICTALIPLAARIVTVAPQNPRATTAAALAEIVREAMPGLPCTVTTDLVAALELAEKFSDPVLICGSLFLVGEALAHFQSGAPPTEVSAQ